MYLKLTISPINSEAMFNRTEILFTRTFNLDINK